MPQILNGLGQAALGQGDLVAARAHFQESQALCRELGNRWDAAGALLGEGHVRLVEGDAVAARASYLEALRRFASLPDWDEWRRRTGLAACLRHLADMMTGGDAEWATRLWSGAEAIEATVGRAALRVFEVAYPLPHNRVATRFSAVAARAALGEEGFQAAWQSGQKLTLEQAVAEALAVEDVVASPNQVNTHSKEKEA